VRHSDNREAWLYCTTNPEPGPGQVTRLGRFKARGSGGATLVLSVLHNGSPGLSHEDSRAPNLPVFSRCKRVQKPRSPPPCPACPGDAHGRLQPRAGGTQLQRDKA